MTRATWSEKYPETEHRPPALNVSTAILGVGIFIVGLILLAVGLIIGLKFPDFAQNRVIEEQCVTSKSHSLYKKWVDEGDWVRYNKLYYWVVSNPHGYLYLGHQPVMTQRGPYIYREYRQKTDVVFTGSRVSFSINVTQVYDSVATRSACADCHETDSITLLSVRHLRTVYRMKGLDNFIYSQIPEVLNNSLWNSTSRQTGIDSDVLQFFGCLSNTCESALAANLSNVDTLRNMSVGSWIQMNDTEHKAAILKSRAANDSLETEVTALYHNILSSGLFGVSDKHFLDVDVITQCESYIYFHLCNSSTGNYTNYFSSDEIFYASCGLLSLVRFRNIINNRCYIQISDMFVTQMCKSANLTCYFQSDNVVAYYSTFRDFIVQTLTGLVYQAMFVSGVHGILETGSQGVMATGYSAGDYGRAGPELLHHTAGGVLPQTYVMSTCLGNTAADNMDVKQYRDTALESICMSTSHRACTDQSGHSLYSSVASTYSACVLPDPDEVVTMFEEDVYEPLLYTNPGETDIYGIRVHRFKLNTVYSTTDTYTTSGTLPCMLGDVTDFRGFPSIITVPNMNPCTVEPASSLNSFVDVEPFTGKVWRKVVRLQTNALLRHDDVNSPGLLPYNVSVSDGPFPVYWKETVLHITEAASDHHHDKVTKLMDASCGGLISLSIVSIAVVITSILIVIRPHRKVAPLPVGDDDVTQNTHSN